DGLLLNAGFGSIHLMHVIFVLLGPLARSQQNDELSKLWPNGVVEAKVLARLLQAAHQLGAAEKRNKGPLRSSPSARARRHFLEGLLLRFGHLLFRNRGHAILRRGRADHEQQNTCFQSKRCKSHGQTPPPANTYDGKAPIYFAGFSSA